MTCNINNCILQVIRVTQITSLHNNTIFLQPYTHTNMYTDSQNYIQERSPET